MPSDAKADRLLRNQYFNNAEINDLLKRVKSARLNGDLRNDIVLALAQLLSLRASVFTVHKGFIEPCELLGHAKAEGILNNVVLDESCQPNK
ncbi:MAG: hypothetical protein KGL35_08010 [Bradyrhizobium sp.]|nr:hypothetical protein [Bradyrhizobium sp.]